MTHKGFSSLTSILLALGIVIVGGAIWYFFPKTVPQQAEQPPIVGGDKDAHGCIGSAGYQWCEVKQKCLRVWEEACTISPAIKDSVNIDELLNAQIPNFAADFNEMITLSDGKAEGRFFEGKLGGDETPNTGYTLTLSTSTSSYASGDLTGDGVPNVVATIRVWSGGSGYFTYLTVFENSGGNFKYLASKALGDRIKVNSVNIESSIISVDIITQGPNEPMCCGTLRVVRQFRMTGNDLVEL